MPWWPALDRVENELCDYLYSQPSNCAALDAATAAVAAKLAADRHYVWQRVWRLHEFGRTVTIIRAPDGSHLVRLIAN